MRVPETPPLGIRAGFSFLRRRTVFGFRRFSAAVHQPNRPLLVKIRPGRPGNLVRINSFRRAKHQRGNGSGRK
jgi:hypothetical protein